MKREDVLKVDALRTTLDQSIGQVNQALVQLGATMRGVFGEVVFALDTVIDRYNALENRQGATDRELETVRSQLQIVSERLLALEQRDHREH